MVGDEEIIASFSGVPMTYSEVYHYLFEHQRTSELSVRQVMELFNHQYTRCAISSHLMKLYKLGVLDRRMSEEEGFGVMVYWLNGKPLPQSTLNRERKKPEAFNDEEQVNWLKSIKQNKKQRQQQQVNACRV